MESLRKKKTTFTCTPVQEMNYSNQYRYNCSTTIQQLCINYIIIPAHYITFHIRKKIIC